jgi:chromosome segregation ATPase
MKSARALLVALCLGARAEEANPLGKVLQLMDDYAAKVTAEGEVEAKAFKDLFEWCDDASHDAANEIETAKAKSNKLSAKIEETTSDAEVGTAKIEELSGAIATAEAELKEATGIRNRELSDFAASEKELMATVDTLERATTVLEKEMAKSGAASAQIDTSSLQSITQTLSVVIDAAAFSTQDKHKLVALVQSHQQEQQEEDEDELGAPAAAAHKSQSGGIVELLEDLKEKAEGELADARKAESAAKHNYAMLKQSLDDKTEADGKDLANTKSAVAAAGEEKAVAAGDLKITEEDLKTSEASLATAKKDCMQAASDHEATVASRVEELKVIAQAKKILEESTGGAQKQSYSLLQVAASSQSRIQLANSEVVAMVKKLAAQHHSTALNQLASRISAAVRYGGSAGEDPFAKVKGLINSMIAKLEKEAESEATEKAYCDEQMGKTKAKKTELEDDVDKLTSKIDEAASRSAELKEEVAEIQAELATLAKTQRELDSVRTASHAAYKTAKSELTQGLDGVRKALGVLRDYYGGGDAAASMLQDDDSFGAFMQQPAPPQKHDKNNGAGANIIAILEVCESDFATNLSKE